MTALFLVLALLLLAPVPFLRSARHRRSLAVLALLVLGLLLFTLMAGKGSYSGAEAVALFFGLIAWFRLAGEFER